MDEKEEIRPAKNTLSTPAASSPSIFILDKGTQPVTKLITFIISFNPVLDTMYVLRLLKIYMDECEREGINYDLAVCQMCHETGFLRFNGSVSRYQNNFCGLGAINTQVAGDWFGSMEEGIRAHIQHLKAYASLDSLQTEIVDKRFYKVKRGTAFTVYDLTGKWATDPRYGDKIGFLLKKLYQYKPD